jgi:DNA-binding PadR family transcriptional regulator
MNLTRLTALGILAQSGPSHGHHIRRLAEVSGVGEWGGVSVGALYRELRAMEREGLVEAARTEKVGNRPERTVYAITAEGHLELAMLREQAIRPLEFGPNPLGVALMFAAHGMDPAELRRTMRARREMLSIRANEVAADLEQLAAKGYLDRLAVANLRRAIIHTEAEVRWHDELDSMLAADAEDEAARGVPGADTEGGGTERQSTWTAGPPAEDAPPRRAAFHIEAEEPGEAPAAPAGPGSAGVRGADRRPSRARVNRGSTEID